LANGKFYSHCILYSHITGARHTSHSCFKDIGEANDVLLDASSKRLYDQGYDIEEIKQRTDQQEHYAQHRGGGGHHGGFGGGFGGFGGFGGSGGF
jgi:curved DNA-binding protein